MNEIADSSPDVSREKKQLEAMLYAIQCFPRINRTQLMKYIFFVDLFTYNKRGQPLLENQYRRLPNGPVPLFGFEKTALPDKKEFNENGEFTIYRMRNCSQPNIYRYRFGIKPGRFAKMSVFQKGERDLLSLTLRSVMFRNTADLCQFTHTYSLWKNHIDGDLIDLGEFKLGREEEDQLELFLKAKVYLTPMRKGNLRFFSKRNEKPPLIEGFPEHLPIYFNEETGEIVE